MASWQVTCCSQVQYMTQKSIYLFSSGSRNFGEGGGARNMKYKPQRVAAIYLELFFTGRGGGMAPLAPLDPLQLFVFTWPKKTFVKWNNTDFLVYLWSFATASPFLAHLISYQMCLLLSKVRNLGISSLFLFIWPRIALFLFIWPMICPLTSSFGLDSVLLIDWIRIRSTESRPNEEKEGKSRPNEEAHRKWLCHVTSPSQSEADKVTSCVPLHLA